MSQVVRIRRVSFRGTPVFLGERHGQPVFSGNPEKVATWLCDGFRSRFNQHRAHRKRYVYRDGERLLGDDGSPKLEFLGGDPVTLSDSQAREQFPHLAAIPSLVLQAPAKIENSEWFAATKRRKRRGGAMPRFRSRKRGDLRFTCWFNGGRNAVFHPTGRRSGMVVIRGQNPHGCSRPGRWALRFHVIVSQPIRDYTSVHVDLAKRSIVFTSPPPTADRSRATGDVGVDRGVHHAAVTSDGEFFDLPDTTKLDHDITAAQKRMAKSRVIASRDGRDWRRGKRYGRLRDRHRRLQARRAAIHNDALHAFTRRMAETYRLVICEDLHTEAMSRKGQGRRKRSTNRGIRDARWAALLHQLAYKTGGNTVTVNPAYTSQRCYGCGHIAAENRESQAVFCCVACGHRDNADINAAKNIAAKHHQGWTAPARSGCKTLPAKAGIAAATKRKPLVPAVA